MSGNSKLKESLQGFKSITGRNAILIMIINALCGFTTNMKNAVRTMIGLNSIGASAAYMGMLTSLFTLVGFLIRTPAGSLSDTARDKLKKIMIGALALRVVTFLAFGFVSNTTQLTMLYVVDAIAWAFNAVAMPAILASTVDRRAMGSAYAIYSGINQFVASFGRPLALTTFKTQGQMAFGLQTAAIALVPLVLAFFMDSKALAATTKAPTGARVSVLQSFKNIKAGFNLTVLPFGIVTALPVCAVTLENQYMPKLAELKGLSYLAAETAGSATNGIARIVLGVLCDFVSPYLLTFIIIATMSASLFGIAFAATSTMLSLFAFLFKFCVCWAVPLNVSVMKLVPKKRQGSLFATTGLASDAMSVIMHPLIGMVITAWGFQSGFIFGGCFVGVAVIIYFFLFLKYRNAPVVED